MIPQIIHYLWLSGENIPAKFVECINSWKRVMPDYEIKLWSANKFDMKSNLFLYEAYKKKKWAFASDYLRLYILFMDGGIYLDSDVILKKRLDEYLTNDFFTAVEYHDSIVEKENTKTLINEDGTSKTPFTRKPGIGIQAAFMGSVKGHPFLKDGLNYYNNKHFILDNNTFSDEIIAPDIYAMIAEKYGFRYKNELQRLTNNMLILPSEIVASSFVEASERCYAIHCCFGSWRDRPKKNLVLKIIDKAKKIMAKKNLYFI